VDSTLKAPRRELGEPFDATRNGTVPSPWPLVPSGTIHAVSDVTVQVHSRAALTVRLPEPPPEGNAFGAISTEIAHLVALGAVAVTDVDDELQALTTTAMRARTGARSRTRCVRQTACQKLEPSPHGLRRLGALFSGAMPKLYAVKAYAAADI
jgi:hypothetical protein